MSKIQRWALVKIENKGKKTEWDLVTDPEGKWVKWEDVSTILRLASVAVRQCIVQAGRPPDAPNSAPQSEQNPATETLADLTQKSLQ